MTTALAFRSGGIRSGRRNLLMGALTSVMFHVGILLMIAMVSAPAPAGPSPGGIGEDDEARERLIVLLPPPEPEGKPLPALPTPVPETDADSMTERPAVLGSRQYAAALSGATAETDDLSETPPNEVTTVSLHEVATPSTSSSPNPVSVTDLAARLPHLDPYLQRALEVRQDGAVAPQYRVSVISSTDVWRLVHAGLARVIIAQRPFASDFFAVHFSSEHVVTVRPLLPDQLKGLSRGGWASRALQLLGATAQAFTHKLEQTFGVPATDTATFLVVTEALDAFILSEQLRACDERGVGCEEVTLTRGRFVWSGDTLTGYLIESLDLRPGG